MHKGDRGPFSDGQQDTLHSVKIKKQGLADEQVRRPRAANIRRRDGSAIGGAPPSAMRGQGGGGATARLTGSKRVSISQPEITGVEVRMFEVLLVYKSCKMGSISVSNQKWF